MPTKAASRKPVLVVDDDPDILEVIRIALEAEGFAVVLAANGREALSRLHEGMTPCVILLDLMMPVMDGWEFRDVQAKDPSFARIPVVVFSAGGRQTVSAAAAALQATDYLTKPLDLDVLVVTVGRYCAVGDDGAS